MTTATPRTDDLGSLRERIQGDLVLPGDPTWDEARQAWNLAVDQRPVAVAFIEGADDASEVVRHAAERGLRINVQATGHNASAIADMENTILIRTSRMRGVSIDPDARTARVEAGALWADVINPAAEHGLAALAGSALDVAVAGYALGGGLSFLARKHGLAAGSVRAIEVVVDDGRLVRADADNDPDLFWALRGGGGNFGVVTAIELDLFPTGDIYAGLLAWPWERAREVLSAWLRLLPELGDESTSIGKIVQFPPFEEVPEPFRGRQLVVVELFHLGDEQTGSALIEPLRALEPEIDTLAMIPPNALPFVHMDPPEPVPYLSGHRMLRATGEDIAAAADEVAGAESGSPLIVLEMRQLGGALRRPPAADAAITGLPADLALFCVGLAATPEMTEASREAVERVLERFEFAVDGRPYLNFVEEPVPVEELLEPDTLQRLRSVKATYDPRGVFRGNHELGPA